MRKNRVRDAPKSRRRLEIAAESAPNRRDESAFGFGRHENQRRSVSISLRHACAGGPGFPRRRVLALASPAQYRNSSRHARP